MLEVTDSDVGYLTKCASGPFQPSTWVCTAALVDLRDRGLVYWSVNGYFLSELGEMVLAGVSRGNIRIIPIL